MAATKILVIKILTKEGDWSLQNMSKNFNLPYWNTGNYVTILFPDLTCSRCSDCFLCGHHDSLTDYVKSCQWLNENWLYRPQRHSGKNLQGKAAGLRQPNSVDLNSLISRRSIKAIEIQRRYLRELCCCFCNLPISPITTGLWES